MTYIVRKDFEALHKSISGNEAFQVISHEHPDGIQMGLEVETTSEGGHVSVYLKPNGTFHINVWPDKD